MTNPFVELLEVGQSLWYDNIQRSLLVNGELDGLIQEGEIRGVTSNPSIFEKAMAHSQDYDQELIELANRGLTAEQIYERLAIADIQAAADLFQRVYAITQGLDGYVSLEVNPRLARETEATVQEAERLWRQVDRPNLMVKIPATKQGLPAISQAIAAGVNVNVTLIFSLKRYAQVIEAYLEGLEKRLERGEDIKDIASVASFFVSRVDTKVDRRLEEILRREGPGAEGAVVLMGRAAVANAKLAYQQFLDIFEGERFTKLAENGARPQRPLWASTSTKNPSYSDVKYVEELIGPQTVNTLPPNTLDAFREHGNVAATLQTGVEREQASIDALEDLGISMEAVTQELEEEGVEAFANSYTSLLAAVEERRERAVR
jgi:transaldolase